MGLCCLTGIKAEHRKLPLYPDMDSPASSPLIQLRKNAEDVSSASPPAFMAKFFIAGAIAAFIGGAVLGGYLWLALNGQVQTPESYGILRTLHAYIQTYLFFGLFITGFLLQTAPRLLRVAKPPHRGFFAIIPTLFAAVAVRSVFPDVFGGKLFLSLPFLCTLFLIVSLTRKGAPEFRESYAWWVILSLLGLALSPFFPLERAENAHFFLWAGVAPVTFAAGQQFLFAFLGGTRLERGRNRILFGTYLAGAACLLFALRRPELWHAAGSLLAVSLLLYLIWTRTAGAFKTLKSDPLAFAFMSGYGWAVAAALILAVQGSPALDSSLHLLTTGWLTPLIIAISSQVLRAIAGSFLLKPAHVYGLLLLWQAVPLGRGLRSVITVPAAFSPVLAVIMAIVLLPWLVSVASAAGAIVRRTPTGA